MKTLRKRPIACITLALIVSLQAITVCAVGVTLEKKETLEVALEKEQQTRVTIQQEFEKLAEENDAVHKELLTVKQQQEQLIEEKRKHEEEVERLRQESERLENESKSRSRVASSPKIWEYTTKTNITQPCGFNAEELNKALVNTDLKGLGQSYLDAESKYGVNAVVLIAIHAHESGWGNSSLARSNNNLGGIKNRSGGWASFTSKADCIDYSARLLGENYLTPGGLFHNGTDLYSVNIKYCETKDWAGKVVDTTNTILKRIAN